MGVIEQAAAIWKSIPARQRPLAVFAALAVAVELLNWAGVL